METVNDHGTRRCGPPHNVFKIFILYVCIDPLPTCVTIQFWMMDEKIRCIQKSIDYS